jgi:hypothetical protein
VQAQSGKGPMRAPLYLVFGALAAILLAFVSGWWVESATLVQGSSVQAMEVTTFELGDSLQRECSLGANQAYCLDGGISRSGQVGCLPTGSPSYADCGLDNTGTLYDHAELWMYACTSWSVLAAAFAVAPLLRSPRRIRPPESVWRAMALAAAAAAILAPVTIAAYQPMELGHDFAASGGATTQSGVTNTFWGTFSGNSSCTSGSPCKLHVTWGAGIGWYSSLVAAGLLILAALLPTRPNKEPVASPAPRAEVLKARTMFRWKRPVPRRSTDNCLLLVCLLKPFQEYPDSAANPR